jgi:hypothetical protein
MFYKMRMFKERIERNGFVTLSADSDFKGRASTSGQILKGDNKVKHACSSDVDKSKEL